MTDIPSSVFFSFFLYLFIPFLTGLFFRKLKISPVIGYIVGGVIIGNFFSGIVPKETISNFAQFGIILLLFAIGLEINFDKLITLKRFIVVGGLLQIGLSVVFISLVSTLFGFNLMQSILIGIAFSSSSTSLVAKMIQDRGEESSFVGELALGMLMFQDLAFIPFIIIFSFLNNQIQSPFEIAKSVFFGLFEATLIIFAMYYAGKKLIPPLFDKVARISRELLNLLIIVFIFFISFVAAFFHVPIFIATFIAGVLVSQTVEHHHIFSQVRPLRDILAIIFFVFIGSHIELGLVIQLLPQIVLLGTLVIIAKIAVLLIASYYLKFNSRIGFSLAVFLFQVSESAFILLSLAFGNYIFTREQYVLIVSVVLLTLTVTPLLIDKKEIFYRSIRSFVKKRFPSVVVFFHNKLDFNQFPLDELTIKNHIVICGYGRVGAAVGRALMLANIPYVAIDYNFYTVEKARKDGAVAIYGDPTDIDILDYAQTENAVALVAAMPDRYAQESVLLNAKKLNSHIILISRVHREQDKERMRDLGAHVIVQPELEASLSIVKKLFFLKKLSHEEMVKKIKHFKIEQGIG